MRYYEDDFYEDDLYEDHDCRKDDRCELGDGHKGKCARYVQHDSMCGCEGCARDCDSGFSGPRFTCREL